MFKQVGSLNFLIGVFNLLPIIPLDGGVILKSLIWHFTGSKRAGIKVAITSARLISFLTIFVGTLSLLRGSFYIARYSVALGYGWVQYCIDNVVFGVFEFDVFQLLR